MSATRREIKLKNPVIVAPMAGVTDKAFRLICQSFGAGLTVTEMINDLALLHGNSKTRQMIDLQGEAMPVAVQIFGSSPEKMAEAARIVEEAGASMIDINMGCPAPKIVKNGEGAALMLKPELAEKIVMAVKNAVSVPVSVKIRKGFDDNTVNAIEFAQRMEAAGADLITVHGRTREQFYSGKADWEIIRRVKQAVKVKVAGNGDVDSPQKAKEMLELTGVDFVMIGRAVMGNPWLIQQIVFYLERGEILPKPSPQEKAEVALRHFEYLLKFKGEYIAVREMRKHGGWYFKGLPGASRLREILNRAKTPEEVREALLMMEKN
ncbi:tRNA dihydrouridine synthase DusB [Carboxydothermus hydrogenoformans]|uniref:tRNA-dihydrouridine synthase n=1 Tax=Carboxydothermus hydrogenoformans (strain ATCC BAA-161 / DSM 6008 / Z-2901) TaxID=246194 RepID=Q3A9L8_CARHZ|nr:tRNA dihydrouridine synthase DusB [Carboxydothermus hydrogenoformans]ABB15340.1 putative TIM-barrel protein, NifR3 family [Carboxydothermus hydrogenoformans Z-2901]